VAATATLRFARTRRRRERRASRIGEDDAQHREGERHEQVPAPDLRQQGSKRLWAPLADLAREPGTEDVVVQVGPRDEEADEHPLHRQHPVEGRRRRVEGVVVGRQPEPRDDGDRERAPADRTPAAPELAQERRAGVALEPLDRRHGDEHERDGAADPDRGGEQVHGEKGFLHAGSFPRDRRMGFRTRVAGNERLA
jgi:hypothetical protein